MSYALITGASKGIGKSIAAELAKKGYDILLVARSGSLLEAVTKELKNACSVQLFYLATDLSKANSEAEVFQWCQSNNYTVSVLVNNAGYGLCGNFEDYELADNKNMMQLNMTTLVAMCQVFLPMLKQQPQSYILNISGVIAHVAMPGMNLYAATKVFVLNYSRALKHELAGTSVSVSCLSPGATDTEFVSRAKIKEKALKAAKKVNMTAEEVATIGVQKMLAGKTEIVPGFINKLSVLFMNLLPKSFIEKTSAKIYK